MKTILFMPAYNAEKTLEKTYRDIPEGSVDEIILGDDASKACTDILARSYFNTYGLPVAVTRCANIYGGGDLNFSRIISDTLRCILHNAAPVIRSDGSPVRE